jgi:hypothetical protein
MLFPLFIMRTYSESSYNAVIKGSEKGRQTSIKNAKARQEEYMLNPVKCLNCEQPINYHNRLTNKFCSRSCSASFNNRKHPKVPRTKKCRACTMEIISARSYCLECYSNLSNVRRILYIEKWIRGEVSGGNGFYLSHYVKTYLKDQCNNTCPKCGWSEKNIHTGIVPLEINHINNNPFDHSFKNLEVLCPNCHALVTLPAQSTKGKGRYSHSTHPHYATLSKDSAPGLS